MKRLWACCSALILLSGCVTKPEWHEEPATMRLLDNPPGSTALTLTLKDGRIERLDPISDYGDALCDYDGCVRKQDVATIGYFSNKVDVGASAAAAPVLVGLGGVIAVACLFGCNPAPNQGGAGAMAGDKPTPDEIRRQWIDGLAIERGVVVYRGISNPCMSVPPQGAGQIFVSDDEALAWITANRNAVGLDCLNAAFNRLNTLAGSDATAHRDARMKLFATIRVRAVWNWTRCEDGWPYAPKGQRIGPNRLFDLKPRKGDPAQIALIEQTLADPASYSHAGDLGKLCAGKTLPRDQWPEPLAWGEARRPFSPVLPPKR